MKQETKSLRAGFGVKFEEAIEYFKAKGRVPTQEWTDIMGSRHGQAFVVAGAMKDSLLEDFQAAILKAIEDGTTLETFREDFDKIVARHGWRYKGGRRWRTAVIYDTNLRQAAMAGRWKQVWRNRHNRPFLRYVALKGGDRRPEHQALHGLIRPVEDPIWETIMPMNGWGCKCTVQSISQDDLDTKGYKLTPKSPDIEYEEKTVNRRLGAIKVRVPKGFDPGFDYNPGRVSWTEKASTEAIAKHKAAGGKRWESLDIDDWHAWGRPEEVPVDKTTVENFTVPKNLDAMTRGLSAVLGGDEKIFTMPDGGRVLVNAKSLSDHLAKDLNRGAFFPFLPEILENPFEIWVGADRELLTGRVVVRKRVIKRIAVDGVAQNFIVVLDIDKGFFAGWTFYPAKKPESLNKKRRGLLTWPIVQRPK